MIIIGIDPDSKAHGVAIYRDGLLSELASMTLMEFMRVIDCEPDDMEVHIENVCGMSAVFRQRQQKQKDNPAVQMKMSNSVGRCQQSQIEVERLCEYLGLKVVRHKIAKNWKDSGAGKKQFQAVTGWPKSGNEDTRSAAYFGFLGHKSGITKIN